MKKQCRVNKIFKSKLYLFYKNNYQYIADVFESCSGYQSCFVQTQQLSMSQKHLQFGIAPQLDNTKNKIGVDWYTSKCSSKQSQLTMSNVYDGVTNKNPNL